MSKASGEIYFIGETDYLTGKSTSFYKIGVVREAKGRDSASRLKEHQTANPRKLSVDCTIKTPLVHYIEGLLHGLYASNRVEGEWFDLNPTELAAAKNSATELAAQAVEAQHIREKAEELKNEVSVGGKLEPTDEQRLVHVEYCKAASAVKELDKLSQRIKVLLREALEAGEDVGDMATTSKRDTPKLSEAKFKTTYPELFKAYLKISGTVTGSFKPTDGKGDPAVKEFVEKELNPILVPLRDVITGVETGAADKSQLRSTKFTILAHSAAYKWLAENARWKLQVACGTAPGITGLCEWKRAVDDEPKLDEAALKRDHPEEYASCVEVKQINVVNVQRRRGAQDPEQQA